MMFATFWFTWSGNTHGTLVFFPVPYYSDFSPFFLSGRYVLQNNNAPQSSSLFFANYENAALRLSTTSLPSPTSMSSPHRSPDSHTPTFSGQSKLVRSPSGAGGFMKIFSSTSKESSQDLQAMQQSDSEAVMLALKTLCNFDFLGADEGKGVEQARKTTLFFCWLKVCKAMNKQKQK
jgi:hypothetical protein